MLCAQVQVSDPAEVSHRGGDGDIIADEPTATRDIRRGELLEEHPVFN